MNSLRILALAALLATLATPATAAPEHAMHGKHEHGAPPFDGDHSEAMLHHLMRMAQKLDLDEAQQTRIHEILQASREDLRGLTTAGAENRQALHDVLTTEPLDEEALAKAADAAGDLVAERIVIAAHAARAVMAELSEEQRARLNEMREEHLARMRERRGAD